MKKILILSAAAIMSFGAMAQQSVVKDAEKAMKSGKSFTEVVKIVTPAFSDPETANSPQPYFIAGKAGMNTFDQVQRETLLNPGSTMDKAQTEKSGDALIQGYEFFLKALPLDQLPDAKGKVKPKYTKDIYKLIGGHFNDFNGAGINFYNHKEYGKAYDAWQIYLDIAENPELKNYIAIMPADSTKAEIAYFQGLAAYMANDFPRSLAAFRNSIDRGNRAKDVYDNCLAVAARMEDENAINEIATMANAMFGDTDASYIGHMINTCIKHEDYPKAMQLINDAIAQHPNVSDYYRIKGIIQEQDGINQDPTEAYEKAIALDPQNSRAMQNYGAYLYTKASKIDDEAPVSQINEVRATKVIPLVRQALTLFENALSIAQANDDDDAYMLLQQIDQIYYFLGEENPHK